MCTAGGGDGRLRSPSPESTLETLELLAAANQHTSAAVELSQVRGRTINCSLPYKYINIRMSILRAQCVSLLFLFVVEIVPGI